MAKGIPLTGVSRGLRLKHQQTHTLPIKGKQAQMLMGPGSWWSWAELRGEQGCSNQTWSKTHGDSGVHTRSHSSLTLSLSTPASSQAAHVDTAASPPCYGYYTRLLVQAVADSRLTLHPANLLHTSAWNKQTKPRDLLQPAFHSTTIRTSPLHCLPLPLSWTPEPHTTHHNQCLQSDPYKTRHISTAIFLIRKDTSTSLFTLHHPRTATKKTPTHTKLLLHSCTQSLSHNFNFRSSQLSQHLPHPPRTTNTGFLQGPELFMCRARMRIAFAEAMNDLSSCWMREERGPRAHCMTGISQAGCICRDVCVHSSNHH